MRRLLSMALLLASLVSAGISQQTGSSSQPQDQTIKTPESSTTEAPNAPDQKKQPQETTGKKGNPVTRKLHEALPDCISIIFSKCTGNSAREQKEQERTARELARAQERCEKLSAARPVTHTEPTATLNESSSKIPGAAPPY